MSYMCRTMRPAIVHMKIEKTEKCRNKCPTKVNRNIETMVECRTCVLQK